MFACLKEDMVVNVVVADQAFVDAWEHDYDDVVPCNDRVGIGYRYSAAIGFTAPEAPADPNIIEGEIVEPAIEAVKK